MFELKRIPVFMACFIYAISSFGCSKESPAEPEEKLFPSGSVVYEHRELNMGYQPDIYISPVSEDHGRRSESVKLTSDPSEDIQPIFSPDGNKVYFSSNRNGGYDLFEIDITDITNPTTRQLTNFEGDETVPTAHPNGTEIFFLRNGMGYGQPDILSYSLATGDTSTVYADAGDTRVLRYEPANDDFIVLQGKIKILDPSTETETQFHIPGTGPSGVPMDDKPISTFDLSIDGSFVYASVNYWWSPTSSSSQEYYIYKYTLSGVSHGIIRSKAISDIYNWWLDIREMENTDGWVLYTESSPGTNFKSRIRITDGTYTVGVSLATQLKDGKNSNPDYTTREVFAPPPG